MHQVRIRSFLCIFGGLVFCGLAVCSADHSKRLRNDLLKNYNRDIRPFQPPANATTVHAVIVPMFLVQLNEKTQQVTLGVWMASHWNDERLKWNENEYGGIKMMHFGAHEVWQPDIMIFYSYMARVDVRNNSHTLVFSNGEVYWAPPGELTIHCKLQYESYPNDEHMCVIEMGSWSHFGSQIEVYGFEEVDLMDFFENNHPQWSLTNMTYHRVYHVYPGWDSYNYLEYWLIFRRRVEAQLRVVWGPSLVILMMSLTMFWLPPKLSKLLIGSISLLCLALLLVYVASNTVSPVAVPVAVSPLLSVIYIVTSEVVLEMLVISLSAITGGLRRPPDRIMALLRSDRCRPFVICFQSSLSGPSTVQESSPGGTEPLQKRPTPQEEWNLLSIALDRVLFVVFVVVVTVFYVTL